MIIAHIILQGILPMILPEYTPARPSLVMLLLLMPLLLLLRQVLILLYDYDDDCSPARTPPPPAAAPIELSMTHQPDTKPPA